MFSTPKIAVFMQKASVEGRKENKVVRFLFYITPLKHALAAELSPIIADRLFSFDAAGAPHPIDEMDGPHFNIGKIPLQLMEMHPSDDPQMDKYGVMLERVSISHLCAKKIFPDDPNFTLQFRAEVPMDNLAIQMLEKFYDEKLFLTFEGMQLTLPNGDTIKCEECDDPAICHDEEGNYYCDKHRKKGTGEITYITKIETPAQIEAANKVIPTEETTDDDRKDTSHINRKRTKKKQETP